MTLCCLKYCATGSIDKRNKAGDKGKPCWIPQKTENESECKPFVHTTAEGLLYKTLTISIKLFPKPNLPKTTHKYSHSIQSNDKAAQGKSTQCDSCITYNTWRTLSAANRPFINPT